MQARPQPRAGRFRSLLDRLRRTQKCGENWTAVIGKGREFLREYTPLGGRHDSYEQDRPGLAWRGCHVRVVHRAGLVDNGPGLGRGQGDDGVPGLGRRYSACHSARAPMRTRMPAIIAGQLPGDDWTTQGT